MTAMRKLVLAVILLAVPAFAQSIDKPTRVSVYINPGWGWSAGSGNAWNGGYGLALEHRFSRLFSGEISVATEQHEVQPYFFSDRRFKLRTYPIDAIARYTFQSVHTRWRPYAGLGVRFVGAPDEPPNVQYEDQLNGEVVGGVEFNAAESWSLEMEARHLVRNQLPEDYDELFKVSLGVGWRF